MDRQGRRIVSDFYKANGGLIAAQASAIEGDGFWGSAVRSVMVAVTAATRSPYPVGTFATGTEALRWACQKAGKSALDTQLAMSFLTGFEDLQTRPSRRPRFSLRPSRHPFL